jgi:hypothetical protein
MVLNFASGRLSRDRHPEFATDKAREEAAFSEFLFASRRANLVEPLLGGRRRMTHSAWLLPERKAVWHGGFMKRYVLALSAGILTLAVAAFAGDVWKDKPYESWDQKDVQKILNDSPWGQSLEIQGGANDAPTAFSPTGDAAHRDQSLGSQTNSDAKAGMGGPQPAGNSGSNPASQGTSSGGGGGSQKFVARWVSARTMREALVRFDELNGKPPADAAQRISTTRENYELVLLGTNLRAFQAAGEDALKNSMYLETKKTHQKISPLKVQLAKDPDGNRVVAVLLEFPKKEANGEATIATDEKGVDFIAEAGKTKLKFHFDLAKMTDKQGADL